MMHAGDIPNRSRLIDTWFPCPEVDEAVQHPEGSGLSEKALFTWFASRPIAQARAAVITTLIPERDTTRNDIKAAVLNGDLRALERLRGSVLDEYHGKPPVVLDLFSGRGIIPLEAARVGATAVGTDLSPVAVLAGRLLADYPLRDWSNEPLLPFGQDSNELPLHAGGGFRLVADVERVIYEVQRRVVAQLAPFYPGNPDRDGATPWAYLWAVTIPCDRCSRRFPLLGSLVLRHPYKRTGDLGQCLVLDGSGDQLLISVAQGTPTQSPTFASPAGKKGKSARCPYDDCGHTHNLDTVKAKGFAGQYEDTMIAVAEVEPGTGSHKVFRSPRPDEIAAATSVHLDSLPDLNGYSAIPDESIPAGNKDNVRASGYGYETYGSLMNPRQALRFAATAQAIAEVRADLAQHVRDDYAKALTAYAASNIIKQIRYATRGACIQAKGKPDGSAQNRIMVDHIFSSQSVVKHQFDYLETGLSEGPGTWLSVSNGLRRALEKCAGGSPAYATPVRFRRASATALPFRDGTIDAIVCDPPYYDMIAYADSSDLFYVWLKRALGDALPDLFGPDIGDSDGLQDKSDEIIVKGRGAKGAGDPRSSEERYERLLSDAFAEARRVLTHDGRMTVIFGHSDPEAWKRLLSALTDAGFVVTSSWPSRTETAVTGVATISVTVSIGCLVAPPNRPVGIAAQVDAAVIDAVKARCKRWDADGLALEDQQMAAYGAALAVVGEYERVITPDGATVPLEHYMTLARKAVRQSVALRLDSLPLETFDALTRFSVFWMELYGRADVPKGEAKFFAMSDELRIEDLRDRMVSESSKGFRLRYDAPQVVTRASSRFEVVRGMAAAWPRGTEAVAQIIEDAELVPTDQYLWAVADWLSTKLPTSDAVSGALAAIKRNKPAIQAAVSSSMAMTMENE